MTQQLSERPLASEYHDRRRREARVACDRPLSILRCANDDRSSFEQARLTDCSPHGLGLMLSERLEAGQQILARLEVDHKPALLMYSIRYCIPMQANQFRAGAHFTGFAASKFRGEMNEIVANLTATR